MSNKLKAQLFSTDFMFAITLFIFAISLVFLLWNYVTSSLNQQKEIEKMYQTCLYASEIWVKEGYPIYWSPNDVKVLGMVNDNRINSTKLYYLSQIGYENVSKLLNVLPNKLYFKVFNETHTLFEFGVAPHNAKNVMKVTHLAILNSSLVRIETMVWR